MTNWGTKKRSIDDNIDEVAAVDSPILLTQYSSEASQLIKSFTRIYAICCNNTNFNYIDYNL